MHPEPRPRVSDRKIWVVIGTLLIGAIGLAVTLSLMPAATVEGKAPEPGGRIQLELRTSSWIFGVGTGLSMALMTVSFYELLSLFLQWGIWRRFDRSTFDAFFGEGAADHCGAGIILLQADKFDVLLEQYKLGNPTEAINSQPKGRLFKAREWVNFCDTQGARAIIAAFRELGLDAPKLHLMERGDASTESTAESQAPFVISMGLAYSDETVKRVGEVCHNWMRIERTDEYGDVVEVLRNLVPDKLDRLEFVNIDPDFRRLVPREWDLRKWLEGDSKIRDYAVILRHTQIRQDGHRQVTFVVAGFTERGTEAAGTFLAANWRQLWAEHVKGKHDSGSLGDFVLLIEGPSHWQKIEEWGSDRNLPAITPSRLVDIAPHIEEGPWVKRMGPQAASV